MLYSFGGNSNHQLGNENNKNPTDFKLNKLNFFIGKKIKNFECGSRHNLILLGFKI
jgi:alpha-tubulin suppressor-like RCC1 family protein